MSGWDNFGDSGKKAYWDASLNIFQFVKFAGADIELRIVTAEPFNYSTHWYYKDLEDAYLHHHDMDALKAKYGGRLNGKTGPKQRSFECCDYDSQTKTTRREHCLLCTTYEDFAPWANRTSLVQAFWRIPNSPNPQLQRWQNELRTFSFNKAASKKLGVVIRQKGATIHDPAKGYTVLVTYNANSGADTWNVAFGERMPLPASMQAFAAKSRIDFSTLYQPGDPAELERDLNKIGYASLLDGSFVPGGAAPPRAAAGRAAPGRAAAPAAGRRPAAAPPQDDFGVDEDLGAVDGAADLDGGFDPDAGAGFADDGFDPAGGFADDGFGAGVGDDMGEPGDEFEEPVAAPPPRRAAAPAARPAPPRSVAAPARAAAPPQRPQAPAARPAAPAARPTAPVRQAAPPTRPAAPRPGYGR